MSSVIVSNEFFAVETTTKIRGDNIPYRFLFPLRLKSALPLITRTDDRPALPDIKTTLLVVFLSSNYR